jgi:glycosyltransferase involved in cell wall biosynthesis
MRTTIGKGSLLIIGTIPPPFGGIASHLGHAIRYWSKCGYEVHVKSLHYGVDYSDYVDEGIFVHQITLPFLILFFPLFVLTRPLIFWQILHQAWLAYRITAHTPTFLRILLGTVLCYQILTYHETDLIMAYQAWPPGIEALLLKRYFGTKVVITLFGELGANAERIRQTGTAGQVRAQLRQADHLMAMSRYCARTVRYIELDAPVTVIPYGVNVRHFNCTRETMYIRECHGLSPDQQVVLYVGRLETRLGPQVLIEAAPRILERLPNARIMLVGRDFGLERTLKRRVRELGLEKQLVFAGAVSYDDLALYYAACDVLVYPSVGLWGCGALAALEAMATCKPVVASRIHGIPEIVLDGETGVLVEPGDQSALAKAVINLLKDRVWAEKIGRLGRQRVEQIFDENFVAQQIEEQVVQRMLK